MALRVALLLLLLAAALLAETAKAGHVATALARLPVEGDGGLSVGDWVDEEEEMGMESESARRGLRGMQGGRGRFISYGALSRDRVPCNRRGQSYYNCRRRGRANPYRRGCSIITRCARVLN